MMLKAKHCTPCREGAPALSPEAARALLKELPGWEISQGGKWLEKTYRFTDFAEALKFVNHVGDIAEAENHHPDFTLGWGYAGLRLQTHTVGGLHENDFIMAAKINAIQ